MDGDARPTEGRRDAAGTRHSDHKNDLHFTYIPFVLKFIEYDMKNPET